jgi:3-oxoacyl-[acyl-carrier protein] reductase
MLAGRVVLVTGGGTGIGRGIALGLADADAAVVAADGPIRSRAEAERAFAEATEGVGSVDAVVHALADPDALTAVRLEETDEASWGTRCEAVLRTALWCCQAAFVHLSGRGGRLVLVTPTVGLTGAAGLVPYATAVEGMRALAKSAARQWGEYGITVNCVAPPVELMAPAGEVMARSAIGAAALPRPPDGRADIAPVVAALVADPTRSVTGATLAVDGGVVMAP